MTATVTPIHARRAGHAISEGTASARRINRPHDRASLTADALLLDRGVLHRVDAAQIPPDATGGAAGHCRTPQPASPPAGCTHDCSQGDRCTCAPQPPGPARSLLWWAVALLVVTLLAAAVAVMGPPQDH